MTGVLTVLENHILFRNIFFPQSPESLLSDDLQPHGQKTQKQIYRIESDADGSDPVHNDLRVIENPRLIEKRSHQHRDHAPEYPDDKASVAVIKAIDGICGSSFQGISSAFHGI